MIWYLKIIFISVNIFVFIKKCEGQQNITTIKTVFVETTTQYVTLITDIPEDDVNQALHLDYGRYTTHSFAYFNSQFERPKHIEVLSCFDSHIRCLVTVIVPHPVCGVNIQWDKYEGFRTFETYCDAYLDNCFRKMRFWRIYDFGACYFDTYNKEVKVKQTRRKIPQNFKNVFKLLSDPKSQN